MTCDQWLVVRNRRRPGRKGEVEMAGATCKKNARRFRNPKPRKDLGSEEKIFCRYALSNRWEGSEPPMHADERR